MSPELTHEVVDLSGYGATAHDSGPTNYGPPANNPGLDRRNDNHCPQPTMT
jgi:hypothetical protein